MSPDDNRIDVVNVEQSSFDDRSSIKSGRNGDCGRSWTMAKVQVGYDITRKGERSLVVDGFKFTKSRDGTNNRVFWRCSRRECKATAVTVCDRVEHVRAIHAHEPPLAAEFFGSQEGVSQRCQLQEVRFNTSAANMRPRYRRSTVSGSEGGGNAEESTTVKDISNSNGVVICDKKSPLNQTETQSKPLISLVPAQSIFQFEQKPVYTPCTGLQRTPSVKEQVRDFILRNSNAQPNNQTDSNVSVAQFLISPASQTPQFIQTNTTPLSANSSVAAASTIFNFSTMQINTSPNALSDSTSDAPSHKSTSRLMNLPTTPHDDSQFKNNQPTNDGSNFNSLNIEQIIHVLLNRNSEATNRQRSCSDSEWMAANSSAGAMATSYDQDVQEQSPTLLGRPPSAINPETPTRLIHWKKEKLRESEICDDSQFKRDRKRRHNDINEIPKSAGLCNSAPQSTELYSFLDSFRPTITHKLMGVMQKLSSELCPEVAIAQEVFEKCTAIKTCLETLEKLHSLMT